MRGRPPHSGQRRRPCQLDDAQGEGESDCGACMQGQCRQGQGVRRGMGIRGTTPPGQLWRGNGKGMARCICRWRWASA